MITTPAKVIAKSMEITGSFLFVTTIFRIGFETPSRGRISLVVDQTKYNTLIEGDAGTLRFTPGRFSQNFNEFVLD